MRFAVSALLVALVLVVARPRPAEACLWDYDTLKEEKLGQADVASVIGGDLHKHSKTFYEAKVAYTRALIDKGGRAAKADRYDDLAVAHAKLGQLDEAIAVLEEKEQRFPGLYTTEANLGTFLALKGDLKGGLDHLRKGMAINPDAHFGREKFQIQLLEFLAKLAADKTLAERENLLGIPMSWEEHRSAIGRRARTRGRGDVPTPPVVALIGMIRFGDAHDNPHAWAALGWALVAQGDLQLALRALRRANQLGLPWAPIQGTLAAFLREVGGQNPTDLLENEKAWNRLAAKADAEWKRGQAASDRRQRAEDARLAKKQYKAVFGY